MKKIKGRRCCSATPSRFLLVMVASQVTAHRFLRRQRSLSATLTHCLVCRSKDKQKKQTKKTELVYGGGAQQQPPANCIRPWNLLPGPAGALSLELGRSLQQKVGQRVSWIPLIPAEDKHTTAAARSLLRVRQTTVAGAAPSQRGSGG